MIKDKALDLGRQIGQSDEYKALQRARAGVEDAATLHQKLDRIQRLAEEIERVTVQGDDPPEASVQEYDSLLGEIQTDSRYQQLVAAQSNFDKLMLKVHEHMAEGMRKGAESPIITLG